MEHHGGPRPDVDVLDSSLQPARSPMRTVRWPLPETKRPSGSTASVLTPNPCARATLQRQPTVSFRRANVNNQAATR
jgi:hypothetical protein